jgi:ferritin-like metal-binding protein YciE
MTMTDGTLRDAFLEELRAAYDAEKQLTKALPRMARAASALGLRALFEKHLEDTRTQLIRLERIFESFDERARGNPSDGIAAIIVEGQRLLQRPFDRVTLDACLVASGKRLEHYEIASYTTLVSWARAMSFNEIADVLQQTLDEEQAAADTLTSLAEHGINQDAADAAYPDMDSDDEIQGPAPRRIDASKRRSVVKTT